MKFPPEPKTPYLLPKQQDKTIFEKLTKFKDKKLSEDDEELIELFYSQLEDDWRTPLEKAIDKMAQKYGF